MTVLRVGLKGGPTSGNHGHAGRPGHLGGSVARGVGAGSTGDILEAANVGKYDAYNTDTRNTPIDHTAMKLLGLNDDGWSTDGSTAGQYKNRLVSDLSADTGIPYNDVNNFVHQWAYSSNDSDMRSMSLQKAVADEFGVPLSPWQKQRINDLKHAETIYPKVKAQYDAQQQQYADLTKQMSQVSGARDSIISTADPAYIKLDNMYRVLAEKRDALDKEGNALLSRMTDLHHIVNLGKNDPSRQHIFAHRDTKDPEGDARRVVRAMYTRQQAAFKEAGVTSLTLFRGVKVGHSNVGKVEEGSQIGMLSNAAESWSASSIVAYDFGHGTGGVVLASKVPVSRILTSALTGFGCLEEKEYVVMSSKNAKLDLGYVAYAH